MNLEPPPQRPLFDWIWQKWLNNLYEWVRVNAVSDYALEVSRGNINGVTAVNKFGRSTNVDSGVDTDIHDGANATDDVDTWVAPTQARTHQVTSTSTSDTSAGAGAKTLQVYGLTDWDTAEVSETITMNGTSNVATANTYVIIHRMKVLTKGTSGPNAGVITATADTDTTVTAQINIGEGQTQMAIYGIPSIQTGYISEYYCSAVKGAAAASVAMTLLANPEPDVEVTKFITKHTMGIVTDGSNFAEQVFSPYYKIAGPAIIKMQGNASAINTDVSAGFDIYLVDN